MSQATININKSTEKKFSKTQLERFINSNDFEDIVLAYHMIDGKTGNTQSYQSFKEELGL